ncbi:MAG: hypothetical protein R3C25_06010 [Hyphomonadaceae bacterium]
MAETPKTLTLLGALKDFGWLPLTLLSIGGGLSIIDISERIVFDNLTLATPFQIILDGYHRITSLIGALVEPRFQPVADWLNAQFDWNVHLQPFWQSLFVLAMVFVLGPIRSMWRDGRWGTSALVFCFMGPSALVAALGVGLLPFVDAWWAQSLIAAVPLGLLLLGVALGGAVYQLAPPSYPEEAWDGIVLLANLGAVMLPIALVLGAALSFVPGLGDGAGVLVLGGFVAFIGASQIYYGLEEKDLEKCRTGLSMLGGFVAAALVLLSNWVMAMVSPATQA